MKITRVNTKNVLEFENVEMDQVTVKDEEIAFRVAGTGEGYPFQLALLAQVCTFDGKKLVMEDLERLRREDFLELMKTLTGKTLEDSDETSSSSQNTET